MYFGRVIQPPHYLNNFKLKKNYQINFKQLNLSHNK